MAADKIPANLVVGARVVLLNREDQGIGTVRYVGITKFAPGNWIGIEMDRAVGKNDGTVQGVKYFACQPNFGIFVKPSQVVVQVKKPAVPATTAPTTGTKTTEKAIAPKTDTSRSTSPITTRADEENDSSSTPVATTPAPSVTAAASSDSNTNAKTAENVTNTGSEDVVQPKEKSSSVEDTTGAADTEHDGTDAESDANGSKQPVEDTNEDPRDEPSTTSTTQGDEDDETEYVAELKTQIARLQKVREEEKKKYEEQIKLLKENAQNMNKSIDEQENMRGMVKQLRQTLEQTMEQKNEAEKQLKALEKKMETSATKSSSENTAEIEKLKKQLEEIKEDYEEKILALNEDLELITIDKEFAEEKAENLQMEMNEMKKELEVLQLYKQSTEEKEKRRVQDIESGTVSTQSAEEVKILVAQNERLKEALMKLKDISLSEKQEQERHVQILEKELEVIPSLKGDVADLAEKLDTKEKQIEALKSDLDELKDLQDKFEELFDKHMNLQEENKDLKTTIEELEQLRELADEVEESQAANEKKLRSELYQKQVELLDKETKLINVQHSLKEAEDAIEKLKQAVVDQKKSLEQAKERDITMNERLHELEETARVVSQMNIQISLEKMKAALRDIEDELRGLEVKQARQEVALYKMFLPEEQLKKDQEVVQLQLMMERVSIKCDLVLNYLQKQYQLESLDNLLELDPFAQLLIKLYSMLYRFGYNAQYFLATLRVCDEELYLKLGRLVNEFHGYEVQLDQLVELIKSEKLNKDTSIAEIQKTLDRFDTMANKYLTPDVMPHWRRWQWSCQDLFCTHRSLVFEQLRLEQLLTLVRETRKADNAQEHVLVTPFVHTDVIRAVLDTSRKLIRALRDRNLKEVRATQETLEHFQYNAKLVLDLLVEINRKVKVEFDEGHELDEAHLYKIVKDIPQFVSLWDIIATQLGQEPLSTESEVVKEDGTTEHVPENNRKDFATRMELLDKYYKQSILAVQTIDDNLSRGAFDAEVDAGATAQALTPMQKRAEQLKAELNQAAALKKELEELKAEIQEKERILRNKNQLIEESQWKEKKLEVKITSLESTVKESQDKIEELQQIFANKERIYEQAVKSLQSNLQTLEQENGALKGKMDNMELKAKEAQQLLQTTAAKAEETISIRAFNTQLASMRTAVEILKRENIKLKARAARDSLNQKLPQLPRLTLNARTEADKQTQNVLQSIQVSIATNMVVDLSQGSKQARDQFIEHQQRRAQLRKTALECASKSGRDQHSLLNKTTGVKPVLAGRIELNRGDASKNIVKVVVSHQQLQQIHSSLV